MRYQVRGTQILKKGKHTGNTSYLSFSFGGGLCNFRHGHFSDTGPHGL